MNIINFFFAIINLPIQKLRITKVNIDNSSLLQTIPYDPSMMASSIMLIFQLWYPFNYVILSIIYAILSIGVSFQYPLNYGILLVENSLHQLSDTWGCFHKVTSQRMGQTEESKLNSNQTFKVIMNFQIINACINFRIYKRSNMYKIQHQLIEIIEFILLQEKKRIYFCWYMNFLVSFLPFVDQNVTFVLMQGKVGIILYYSNINLIYTILQHNVR